MLITIPEADSCLDDVIYPEWHLQNANQKSHFISLASTYVRSTWQCPDVDWDDDTTYKPDYTCLIAKYAEAARKGDIYPSCSSSTVDGSGAVSKKTLKAGSLEETTEWDVGTSVITTGVCNPLSPIEDGFKLQACTKIGGVSGGTVGLSRV